MTSDVSLTEAANFFANIRRKFAGIRLPDKLNERLNRKSWLQTRCTFDYSPCVHKAKNRRKTGPPRDLLYMQIKDGYGGNRGMWWRLTETRYRQVSSVKRTLRPGPFLLLFLGETFARVFGPVEDLSTDVRHMWRAYTTFTYRVIIFIIIIIISIFLIILHARASARYIPRFKYISNINCSHEFGT